MTSVCGFTFVFAAVVRTPLTVRTGTSHLVAVCPDRSRRHPSLIRREERTPSVLVCHVGPFLSEPIIENETDLVGDRDNALALLLVLEWRVGLGSVSNG